MTRRPMMRHDWRRLAEQILLAGALRRADLPEGWVADDLLEEIRRFDATLVARGDFRLTILALQDCLASGPSATVPEIVAAMGADAGAWRWCGGLERWLVEHRDWWTVPAFGALRWAIRELETHHRIWRMEQIMCRVRHAAELPGALVRVAALAGGEVVS